MDSLPLPERAPDPRFSLVLPTLQVQVNSSSLGPAKQCARRYEYEIVRGLTSRTKSVDLEFGTLVHAGIEGYDRAKFAGQGHEEALERVVEFALRSTWNSRLGRPIEFDHPVKTRESLVRTLVWYLDKYGQNDLEVLVLNGKPALELSFEFDSGFAYTSSTGETARFIGRLDKIVVLNGAPYIKDTKTTKSGLGGRFFARYTPDNQFSLYTLAGRVSFGVETRGLIADALQIGATFSRFERAMVPRTTESLDEWLRDAHYWLSLIERWAIENYWPQNDKSCGLYGGCPFREICGMRPASRESWLERIFAKRIAGSDKLVEISEDA